MPTLSPARATLLLCAALLVLFAVLSYTAALTKSPTYDEPLHSVAAWLHWHEHDFRVDPEDPPVWLYWAALPNGRDALRFDATSPWYARLLEDVYREWKFVHEALYPPPGAAAPDPDRLINRGRFMMLIVGIALGAMIAWWSWRLGGTVAAVVATAAFALDPNFLAHASLVKNDVALSLVMLALVIALRRAGRKMTFWNATALALACAAGVNIKFSALLLGPIVAVLLFTRAAMPWPWRCLGRECQFLSDRLLAALGLCAFAGLVSYLGIWACYGFRFGPSPDPAVRLNVQKMVEYTALNETVAKNNGQEPTPQQLEAWRPGLLVRMVVTADQKHLLPQAWLTGFLYTYHSALVRHTYLLGKYSLTGWWYYFPLAMLFKSPLALLAAMFIAAAIGIFASRARQKAEFDSIWTAVCLAAPPAIYLLSAMRSNLNVGLRHVLPVYPFLFIGIGMAAGYAWKRWAKLTKVALVVLGVGLALESLAAWPDYIPFFNTAAGGKRGGLRLLGDSNLDWGQDLKLLARWQREHPGVNLYLSYFGMADPRAYGIRYVNFPGGYEYGPKAEVRDEPGVLAISATHLQGIYGSDDARAVYGLLRDVEPLAVLGGSIYLYEWPPRKEKVE